MDKRQRDWLDLCEQGDFQEAINLIPLASLDQRLAELGFFQAIRHGNLPIVMRFLNETIVQVALWDGAPFRHAAYYGKKEVLAFFIDQSNSLPNAEKAARWGLLNDHIECTRLIIDQGIPVSVFDMNDFMTSAIRGCTNAMKFLIESKAVQPETHDINQALRKAAEGNHLGSIQYLLSQRGDPYTEPSNLFPIALNQNNPKLVKTLLSLGLSPQKSGEKLLCMAADKNLPQIMELLLQDAAPSRQEWLPALIKAALKRSEKCIALLLDRTKIDPSQIPSDVRPAIDAKIQDLLFGKH